jgi:periplasmic protein TonB
MNMDDIVFERRNKEYGAYVIRKHYSDHLSRSVILSLGFAALMLALPSIFKSGKSIPDKIEPDKPITWSTPPLIEVEQIKQTIQASVRKAVQDLAPIVTTTPEDTAPPETIDDPVSGSIDGVDGGETVSTGTFDTDEEVVAVAITEPPKIVDHSEIMPSYIGGMEAMIRFLGSKMRYPAAARRIGTQGTVFVQFVIGLDGNVIQAKIIKGISKECDAEALRVISMMPAWNPGLQGGNPVMVRMVLPVKFQLQ